MVTIPADHTPPTLRDVPAGGSFPDRPTGFVHDLHRDERLSLGAIAALADRLQQSVIYDTAAQPLLVPEGGPPRGALEHPGDVIRGLESAQAWLTLLNVEQDPDYADLMHRTLDQLEPGMLAAQGKMRNRAGFIFVSSPNSVTPVHFDIENSLLMQANGAKTVSFGSFGDTQAGRYEIERYWGGSHGRVESMPAELGTFPLTSGSGVYLPPLVPHWVHNGPAVSISITFTYFTNASVRRNRIEDLNARLRRLRLSPRPPGESVAADAVKAAAAGALGFARHVGSGIAGAAGRGSRRAQG